MAKTSNKTTLVSLFHTQAQASEVVHDLQTAGIPQQAIQALGGEINKGSAPGEALTALRALNLPAKDLEVLSEGLSNGGTLIVVHAEDAWADKAESVFAHHNAAQIDERTVDSQPKAAAASAPGDAVIPIVEEQLTVGKRQVERGGVRVFSRIVETPVEEQVVLREERATVERYPVNRPIGQAELDALQNQSIEVRETGEEAVIAKSAHVVEEVLVGKETTERTQKVQDKVRKTQVDIDSLVENETVSQRKS